MKTVMLQKAGMKMNTAVALGCFDTVHLAHQRVIGAAAQNGKGFPSVVLSIDLSHASTKEMNRQLLPYEEKKRRIAQLGADFLVKAEFSGIKDMQPSVFFEKILVGQLRARLIVCGYDFRFGAGAVGDTTLLSRLCKQFDIELIVIDEIRLEGERISSTTIKKLIMEGKIEKANLLMGHPYSIDAKVIKGNALGRTLNFPTINQHLSKKLLLPRFGVYASFSHIDGERLASITNIGIKPTVGGKLPLAETYIFDYNGDLYGQKIRVELCGFIREEQKFSSVSQLCKQIEDDTVKRKKMF